MVDYNDLDDETDSPESIQSDIDSASGTPADDRSPASASELSPATPAPVNPMLAQYLQNKQALAQAQQQVGQNQLISGLGRAFSSLAGGIAGASKPVDQSGFNAMDAAADEPVQNILNQQKSQATDLSNAQTMTKLNQEAKSTDPNSSQSLAAKSLIKKLYPGKFTDDQLDGLAASDIGDSIMKPLELDQKIQEARQTHADALATRQQESADKRADRGVKLQEIAATRDTKQVSDYQGRLDKDKNYQDSVAALNKANDALKIADDAVNNPQSANSLAVTLASLSTGGKRINSAEIERMGGSKAFTDNLNQIVQQGYKGTMTPQNVANAKQYIKIFQDSYTKSSQDFEMRKAGELSQVNNRPVSENYTKLTGKDFPQSGGAAQAVDPTDLHNSVQAEIARRRAARSGSQPLVDPSQVGINAPVDPSQPMVMRQGYAYGGAVGGLPASNFSASQMEKPVKTPAMHLSSPHTRHFDQGGVVPGHASVPGDSYQNDNVKANLSPGEVVIPRHIMESKNPALYASIFIKNLLNKKK